MSIVNPTHVKKLKRKFLAYLELLSISTNQTPIVIVSLGLLCASEFTLSTVNLSLTSIVFAFFSMILIISHIMVLNDYFDVEIDKKKETRIQTLAEIPRKVAGALAIVFLSCGLFFAYLTSQTYLSIILVLVLLSATYSAPPIKYKRFYPFSTIGEAGGAYLLFCAGYSLYNQIDLRALVISFIPTLVLVIGRLQHEIRFVKFDADTGKKTLAVIHGIHKVKLIIRICALSIISLTVCLFLAGIFSASFLFALLVFFGIIAFLSIPSPIQAFYFDLRPQIRLEFYWGYIFYFIVAVLIYS